MKLVNPSDILHVTEQSWRSSDESNGRKIVTQVIRPDMEAWMELISPILPKADMGTACALLSQLLEHGGWSVSLEEETITARVMPGRNSKDKFITEIVLCVSIEFTRSREE